MVSSPNLVKAAPAAEKISPTYSHNIHVFTSKLQYWAVIGSKKVHSLTFAEDEVILAKFIVTNS